jgi:exodeoxyribonuclease VII large subunit
MTQIPLFQIPTWSVTELTRYLRDLLESDENLQDLWVEGEVSNLSQPSSGHLYFTIKDSSSALRCVMWRNAVTRQAFLPRDGDAIEVHGNISLYEASGYYQLYADLIRPAGEGALYQEFLRLKAQLESEGLFDPLRKKPIPPWPRIIGIVTSPTGAALRDMLRTIKRRYPPVEIILAPTAVQGEEAPAGILTAIESLNRVVKPDVILLARGGGSIEDLRAFNDESVARAIVDSQAPVITGVGHETDFTIADFAADLRAATPTAAAELATPDQADLRQALSALGADNLRAMQLLLQTRRTDLERSHSLLLSRSPLGRVRRDRQRLDELNLRGSIALMHTLEIDRARLAGLDLRLRALNPQAILERGFSIVTHLDGRIVRSVQQVQPEDDLQVRVSDGEFGARVQDPGSVERDKP